jgi:hypothetical protein
MKHYVKEKSERKKR